MVFWVCRGRDSVTAQNIADAIANGNATFTFGATSPVTFNGSVTLGDAQADIITVNGTLKIRDTDASSPEYGTITVGNLTLDRTYTFPNSDGTVALLERAQTWSAIQTFGASVTVFSNDVDLGTVSTDTTAVKGRLRIYENSVVNYGEIETEDLTANRTWTFQNATGTVAMLGVTQNWTGTQNFLGNVVLGDAATDTITFGGTPDFAQGTSSTASAGAATLPSNPIAFINVKVDGTNRRIPYYAV